MRMSHIYQPVMLIELLSNKGQSTVRNIAKAILSKDESQIEYYEHITKNMVGRVLTKNRGITKKDKNNYSLIGFDELNQKDKEIDYLKISSFNGDEDLVYEQNSLDSLKSFSCEYFGTV